MNADIFLWVTLAVDGTLLVGLAKALVMLGAALQQIKDHQGRLDDLSDRIRSLETRPHWRG